MSTEPENTEVEQEVPNLEGQEQVETQAEVQEEQTKTQEEIFKDLLAQQRKEIEELIKRQSDGFGKSIGKLRKNVRGMEESFKSIAPIAPKREQFANEDDFKIATEHHNKLQNYSQEVENLNKQEEQEERLQVLQDNYMANTNKLRQSGFDIDKIDNLYDSTVQQRPELAPTEKMAEFIMASPVGKLMLGQLYSDPQSVLRLKSMTDTAQIAQLSAMQYDIQGQLNKQPARQPVNAPVGVTRGSGGQAQPKYTSAQDMFNAYKNKKK